MNNHRIAILGVSLLCWALGAWVMTAGAAEPARSGAAKAPADRGGAPRWVDPDKSEPTGTHYRTFHSDTIKGEASYLVYLPPDYEKDAERRFPVLYWLHGSGGSQRGGAYFVEHADKAIRAGKIPSMIVVLVNGLPGGFYSDSADGHEPVESVIIHDLLPHVDATYRTVAERGSRGIEGFSMGGYGATHLGFKYPELFGVVSDLSGAVINVEFFATYQDGRVLKEIFGGDRDAFQRNHPVALARQNVGAIRGRTQVRIVVGDQDTDRGLLDANRKLHQTLDELRVEHTYTEVPGVRHNYRALYEKTGESAFNFYAAAFAKTKGDSKP